MVERGGLEIRYTACCIGGSNPSLSAAEQGKSAFVQFLFIHYTLFVQIKTFFMKCPKYIQTLKDALKDILIRLDDKLGGQSSTQTHAGYWSRGAESTGKPH